MGQSPAAIDDSGKPIYDAIDDNGNPILHDGTKAVEFPEVKGVKFDSTKQEEPGILSKIAQNPYVSRFIHGPTEENSPELAKAVGSRGVKSQGDDWLEIPGVNKAAGWLADKVPYKDDDVIMGNVSAGIRMLGSMLAGSADPRAVVPEGAAVGELGNGQRLLNEGPTSRGQRLIPETTPRRFVGNEYGQHMETNQPPGMVNDILMREHELRPEAMGDIPLDYSNTARQRGSRFEPVTEIPPAKVERSPVTGRPKQKIPYVNQPDPTQQTGIVEQPSFPRGGPSRRESAFASRQALNDEGIVTRDITPSVVPGANPKGAAIKYPEVVENITKNEKDPVKAAKLVSNIDKTNIGADGSIPNNPGWFAQSNNFAKSMMTAVDLSAPGRQGKSLWTTKAYWTSFDDMFKSWGSQRAYDTIMEGIKSDPAYKKATESGLSLTDMLGSREERFAKSWAEKFPGVKPSERAYVAFVNKLRFDHFKALTESADALGLDPANNKVLTDQIAGYVNNMTGRGHLGKAEKYADALNNAFFSPRYLKSRISILNPRNYVSSSYGGNNHSFVVKQQWRSLAALVSASVAMNGLYSLAGAQVDYSDPTSADFAKARFGNIRMDPNTGLQQPVVLGARLMKGMYDMYINGNQGAYGRFKKTDPWSNVLNFAQNKAAPVPSFIIAALRGTDFDLKPFEWKKALVTRATPIISQDLYQLMTEEDPKFLSLLPFSIMGEGMQQYSKSN